MRTRPFRTFRSPRGFLAGGAAALALGTAMMAGPGSVPAAAAQPGDAGTQALTAEIQGHLDRAQALLDQLLAVKGPRTEANTLETWNDLQIELDAAGSKSNLMENVHPDKAVREAAEKASRDVEAFGNALSLNRGVYDALAAMDTTGAGRLADRLYARTLRDYRRSGVDKDEATRKRIEALQNDLVKLGQDFERNIREGTRWIYLDSAADLDGLPADYVSAHQPDSTGKIRITTEYPDYIPFMTYAGSGAARERLYHEFTNRAYPANREVLKQILAKRAELAGLLGYDNWADYVTEDKMSGSAADVEAFIEKLDAACRERADHDYAMLLARKQKDDPSATVVADWEKSYYQELVKKEQYDFDSQELRKYFDFPAVQQGILDVTSRMFGVTYRKVAGAEVWDPSVDCYEMLDGGKVIGRFYLDLHPRDGKFSHAAAFPIRVGVAGRQIPEAALVCNLPGGSGDGPALMEYDDVTTFLHEFGHLLHNLFAGDHHWAGLSGIATEWDFVEAPSQMLEEWAQDPGVLATFARNFKTGEPIPTELVAKLRRARDFGNGLYVRQQNFYSAISLDAHNRPPDQVDLDAMVPELQAKYSSFPYEPGTHMVASFGHLEGYSAMYYTYMWSLVIAKDMFSKFDHRNLLDPTVAAEYRKDVLEPGGTEDAADLVEHFLGRPYGFDSFRRWLNQGAS